MCRGVEAIVNGSTLDKCVRNSQVLFWPPTSVDTEYHGGFGIICVVCTQTKPDFVKNDCTIYSIAPMR